MVSPRSWAMIYYRRNFVSGASYFFTVNLADRKSSILVEHIGELRAAFRGPPKASAVFGSDDTGNTHCGMSGISSGT
jgi:hypothetical protein